LIESGVMTVRGSREDVIAFFYIFDKFEPHRETQAVGKGVEDMHLAHLLTRRLTLLPGNRGFRKIWCGCKGRDTNTVENFYNAGIQEKGLRYFILLN
jgi:hypothetical protein